MDEQKENKPKVANAANASPTKTAETGPKKTNSAPASKNASSAVSKSAPVSKPSTPKVNPVSTAMNKMKFAPGSTIAVVRIRGVTGMNPDRKFTLELLGIGQSHNATLVTATPAYMGMLRQGKDYISWGPVSEPVLIRMLTKRGHIDGRKISEIKKPEEIVAIAKALLSGKSFKELGVERTFHLTPPSGGFKNRKKNYPYGDLGVRPSMDDVLKAMI
jgi:large subunit ribosomal protein L30